MSYLLRVRLSETAPLPIWVSKGPVEILLLVTDHSPCLFTPFSPILLAFIDVKTSSGTVILPSGVLTGLTLTGSQLRGTCRQ